MNDLFKMKNGYLKNPLRKAYNKGKKINFKSKKNK